MSVQQLSQVLQTQSVSDVFPFQGRLARRVDIQTNRINVNAHSRWDYEIDIAEQGVLIGFSIAVNDPLLAVDCSVFSSDGSETIVTTQTMREQVILGRGMTLGEAEATRPDGTSLDKRGTPHSIKPYVSRYKHTFTGEETDYEKIKGTEDDRWIVLEYAPVIRENYHRIFLSVRNTNETGNRMIHYLSLSRIRFVDTKDVETETITPAGTREADISTDADTQDEGTQEDTQPMPATSVADPNTPGDPTKPGSRTVYQP